MQTCIHSGHSDSNRLICSVGSSSLVVKKPETKTSSSRPLGPGNLKYPFERKAKEFNFVYIPPLPPQNQYSIFLSSPNFASSCEVVVIATNTAKGLPVQTSYSRVRLHKCQPEYKSNGLKCPKNNLNMSSFPAAIEFLREPYCLFCLFGTDWSGESGASAPTLALSATRVY